MTSRLRGARPYLFQGQYFDYDRRIPCTGYLTTWKYCFYTPEESPFFGIHWLRPEIWREDESQTLVHVHTRHIAQLLDQEEEFQCRLDVVENPIKVEEGDIIGAEFNMAQLVPVIGRGLQGSTLYINDGDAATGIILRQVDGLALHIDVEIGRGQSIIMTDD